MAPTKVGELYKGRLYALLAAQVRLVVLGESQKGASVCGKVAADRLWVLGKQSVAAVQVLIFGFAVVAWVVGCGSGLGMGVIQVALSH